MSGMKLAQRMNGLRASEIREILKLTQKPEVISFAGGLPAAELFPVTEMIGVTAEVLESEGHRALQYSTTEGAPALRSSIAARMNRRLGTQITDDEIMITSGSQQGLDLSGRLFLDEGSVVLCESPTYLGAINAFKAYQPRFVEVPTDDEGMIIHELERCLDQWPETRVVYVVPDFQNPSGRCWSDERRKAFLEVLGGYQIPIIEDCPYGELSFEEDPSPPLKALDRNCQVIFLGTFSKVFCPGLRIGWVIAEPTLLEKYVLSKQGADLHTSTLAQLEIAMFIKRHGLDAGIARIRTTYRERRDVMLATMDEEFPPGVRYTRPGGGLFIWVELPPHINGSDLLQECLAENVAFVPGGPFFPNGGHENTMRLNFSAMPPPRIAAGIRRLAQVLRRHMAEPQSAPTELAA